jgi:branched-chain amino acid transport system substrate-binding protein
VGLARAQAPAVKLGILQPVTGALSQDGEYGRLGAELAINEINATGGIRALGGARIEMVFGDARSNPEGGTAEVEKMQAEGVLAVVGGFASPICLAASQAASRYDLPYIVDVGVSDQIVSAACEHLPLRPGLRRRDADRARQPRRAERRRGQAGPHRRDRA